MAEYIKRCTCCGEVCYEDDRFPTIVYHDEKNRICENCSIDYSMEYGKVVVREDLRGMYNIPLNE